jgi:hypothetical protein
MITKKENLMKLFHTVVYSLVATSLFFGITLIDSATKKEKKAAKPAKEARAHKPLTKEQYLERCGARWDCREGCSTCKNYSQCLHNKMQGHKGKNVLRNAVKACKADRQKCTECKRSCMKKWRQAHGSKETTDTEKTAPRKSLMDRLKGAL